MTDVSEGPSIAKKPKLTPTSNAPAGVYGGARSDSQGEPVVQGIAIVGSDQPF